MWDLIVSVPDHCISFYFVSFCRSFNMYSIRTEINYCYLIYFYIKQEKFQDMSYVRLFTVTFDKPERGLISLIHAYQSLA